MGQIHWPGPLFYPPPGMIAVMRSGTRIEIWDDESDHPGCFTGMNLRDGDASTLWGREYIARIEDPADEDRPHLSGHYSATTNYRNAALATIYAAASRATPHREGE